MPNRFQIFDRPFCLLALVCLVGCAGRFEYPLDPDGDRLDAYHQYTAYKRLFPLKSLRWSADKRAICICLSRTFIELREKSSAHYEGTLIVSIAPYHTPLNDLPIAYYKTWTLPPDVVASLLDTLGQIASWKAPVDIPAWHYPYGINADFRGPPYGEFIFEYAEKGTYQFKRYDGFTSQLPNIATAHNLQALRTLLYQTLQISARTDSLESCLPIGTYVSLQGSMLGEVTEASTCKDVEKAPLQTTRPYRNRDNF